MQLRWMASLGAAALLSVGTGAFAQDLPGADELEAPAELPPMEADEPFEETEEPAEPAPETAAKPKAEPATATPAAAQTDASASEKATTAPAASQEEEGDPRLVEPGLNLDGTVGLQHISAAWGAEPKTFRLALLGEFYSGRNTIRFNDVDTLFAGNLLFEASPIQAFSAHLRLKTRSNVNTFGRPQAMLSQGDLGLGVKGSFPVSDGLWVGGQLDFALPTDFGTTGLRLAGMGIRPRGIFSFDGSKLASGVNLKGHLNLGYQIDNSSNLIPEGVEVTRVERFAYELSAYNFFEIGLGFAYDLPYVSPFLAWNLAVPVAGEDGICEQANLPCAADAGFGSFPNILSLGAKAEPVEHLGLHAGLDLGLTTQDAAGLPVTPPWMLIFGASWTIDPRPKIEYIETKSEAPIAAPERVIVGTVVDVDTKQPIPNAVVKYQTGENPQVATETGEFTSYGFVPGMIVKLIVEHPDYQPTEVDAKLETVEGEQQMTIEMKAIPANAVIAGRVQNEAGEPVERPKVKMTGPEEEYDVLANSDGSFEENVKAGAYTVAVSAEGYLTSGRDVEVEVDGREELTITLKPAPEEKLVQLRDNKIEIQQKIFFETGKDTILPRSFGVLDQVASTLIENPQVKKVQIEGHTDDVGGDDFNLELSQARAESVRKYLMESGVGRDRLSAKGFGETRPVLPNTSSRNRSFNRRVEFNIVRE